MLAVCAGLCAAWDQSELEMLELVEEVGRNFYEVLDVPQVSPINLIRASQQ